MVTNLGCFKGYTVRALLLKMDTFQNISTKRILINLGGCIFRVFSHFFDKFLKWVKFKKKVR